MLDRPDTARILEPPKSYIMHASSNYLTTRQLARLWLVSEATIKRWADAGHLHVTRTVGGHRRFSHEDATRFQIERGLGTAASKRHALSITKAATPAQTSGGDQLADQFFDAISEGREEFAVAVLLKAFLDGVEPAKIFDETVSIAMRRVGELWHDGEMSVADEHLATRIAVRAVESFGGSVRRVRPGGLTAVCCGAEDELHDLAVLCAQALLESEGWRVKNLGANTPFFALADAVEKYRPALVCISSTVPQSLARGAYEYGRLRQAARDCGACIVLGGDGFRDEATRRKFPADLYADNFANLADFIRHAFATAKV